MRKRIACAALALALLLSGCEGEHVLRIAPSRQTATPTALAPILRASVPADCTALPVYLDALLLARGLRRGADAFVALRPLCERAGISMDFTGTKERFTLELGPLHVEGKSGQQYYTASGRYVYAPEDWIVQDGALYLPLNALCKLLNLTAEERDGAVYLDGGGLRLLEAGQDYYELNFPQGDVYWLSHIIRSEAGIEPLESKIAVGNVVMNRVKNPDFPDNVFDVIFDHDHSIQFEPVSKGTIHEEPKAEDMIAAYLVLEGADVAGECLYFVNPDFGSAWFDNNLIFVKKIGRHNYYIDRVTEHDADTGTDPAPGT
ncbi:MAG: cell wall hydrolase [Oscillospiraceae bacterium]|nr:cell wall hydrolase [Oscillospiraceae bacterium]